MTYNECSIGLWTVRQQKRKSSYWPTISVRQQICLQSGKHMPYCSEDFVIRPSLLIIMLKLCP